MKKTKISPYHTTLVKVSKIHVLIGLIFVGQIILYDSGQLITPDTVLQRWIVVSFFILSSAVVWYLARLNKSAQVIKNLTWYLILVDILVASFYVYTTRGMASRAVLLFVIPILLAAVLRRKGVIYLTSALVVIAYTLTAVAYFVINFNEGYKLELYGEIGFYSLMLIATGWIAWALVRTKK